MRQTFREGGTSAIEGKILVLEGFYNVFTQSFDTTALYYFENEDVYIIYGSSSSIYNDSFETSWDGTYRFDYLRKETMCCTHTVIVIVAHQAKSLFFG